MMNPLRDTDFNVRRLQPFAPVCLLLAALASCAAGCGAQTEDAAPAPSANGAGAADASKPSPATTDAQAKPSANAAEKPAAAAFEELSLLATNEVDVVDVHAITFTPDSRHYVTGGGEPKIWKVGAAEPLHTFEGLYPLTGTLVEAEAVAVSRDGNWLAIGGGDGIVHVFDFASREPLHTIEAHDNGVLSVAFSADGKMLVSSGYDGKVKTWRTETAEPVAVIDTKTEKAVRCDISPDGKTVVSAWDEVLLWDAETGESAGALKLSEPRVISVREVKFSPDGTQVVTTDATVDFENAAMVWSFESKKVLATLKHEFGVQSAAFSPDGKLLATADMDVRARIWDIAAQQLVQTIEEENATPNMVAWSPDGQLLAVASDGIVRIYGKPGTIEASAAPAEKAEEEPLLEEDSVDAPPQEAAAEEIYVADMPVAATKEELIAALDLEEFPRIEGGDYQTTRKHQVDYLAPLDIPAAREFYRKQLTDAGWKELKQTVSALDTDQSWLRVFEKDGYFLRLFLNTLGDGVPGQKTAVEFLHMGNVDTRNLPAPAESEKTYEAPDTTSYSMKADAAALSETIGRSLEKLGWKEASAQKSGGSATMVYRQNAVTLTVRIMPGTGGKTMLMYSVGAFQE